MSVQITRKGQSKAPVTHITLNNPDKRNAFDNTIIETLIDAFQQAGGDDGRVIVLDAAGKHFSAGADLNWMRAMGALDEQENRADALRLAHLQVKPPQEDVDWEDFGIDGCAKRGFPRVTSGGSSVCIA